MCFNMLNMITLTHSEDWPWESDYVNVLNTWGLKQREDERTLGFCMKALEGWLRCWEKRCKVEHCGCVHRSGQEELRVKFSVKGNTLCTSIRGTHGPLDTGWFPNSWFPRPASCPTQCYLRIGARAHTVSQPPPNTRQSFSHTLRGWEHWFMIKCFFLAWKPSHLYNDQDETGSHKARPQKSARDRKQPPPPKLYSICPLTFIYSNSMSSVQQRGGGWNKRPARLFSVALPLDLVNNTVLSFTVCFQGCMAHM